MLPDTFPSLRSSVPAPKLVRALAPGVLALLIVGVLGGASTLAVHRKDAHHPRGPQPRTGGRATPGSSPGTGPSEAGLRTTSAQAIVPTGRGRGLARLIPCYTVTSRELSRILGTPMAVVGQRAAGENGTGLTGRQREDCFWFSAAPAGPYVVLSDVTTDELRSRAGMSGWTARRYFEDVPPQTRTYLPGIGDAAYAYGPASVAALVGDVYPDVTVGTD